MKRFLILAVITCWMLPALAGAVDFLGAPVVPEAQEVSKTKKRLEMRTPMSHDQIIEFYRNALANEQDIKFRDWPQATYIEDDGKLRWHSITIDKNPGPQGTTVVIMKDNWTWITGTLILRFVAVFVVLLVLFVAMNISGRIISSAVKKSEGKKASA